MNDNIKENETYNKTFDLVKIEYYEEIGCDMLVLSKTAWIMNKSKTTTLMWEMMSYEGLKEY